MSAHTFCRKCGLPVWWSGRSCLNVSDGKDHWDTCSKERTRKALAEGTAFKDREGEGVKHEGKNKYMHRKAAPPKKKDIPPHPKGVLPWEGPDEFKREKKRG